MQNTKTVKIKVTPFRILSVLTSLLFTYLFLTLLFDSENFLKGLGLDPCEVAIIVARRISAFMLGIAVLMGFSNGLPHSNARQYICLSMGITLLGLACDGSFELYRGSVNATIWQAIIIETILGVSFLAIFFVNKFSKPNQQ